MPAVHIYMAALHAPACRNATACVDILLRYVRAGKGFVGTMHGYNTRTLCCTVALQVKTLTGDLRGAGTDANVYLIMHGTLGTGMRHILSSGADDFER